MAAEAGHEPNRTYIDQEGHLHLNGASLFDAGEVDQKKVIACPTAGTKLASGTVTLDGSNPTDIVTGLTTITGAVACFAGNTVLGDDPNSLTVSWSAGTLSITAGKNASGTDPTQVASTDSTRVVSWIAHGT